MSSYLEEFRRIAGLSEAKGQPGKGRGGYVLNPVGLRLFEKLVKEHGGKFVRRPEHDADLYEFPSAEAAQKFIAAAKQIHPVVDETHIGLLPSEDRTVFFV